MDFKDFILFVVDDLEDRFGIPFGEAKHLCGVHYLDAYESFQNGESAEYVADYIAHNRKIMIA